MSRISEEVGSGNLPPRREQERTKIHTRQAEGIAVAKANGKHLGRPQMNLQALTEKQKQTLEELWPQWDKEESKRQITASEFMTKLNLRGTPFIKS